MFTNEENDSIWLYDVLDNIGANEEFRKTCRCTHISAEIMATFVNDNSFYCFGSSCEGAFTPGIIYFIVRNKTYLSQLETATQFTYLTKKIVIINVLYSNAQIQIQQNQIKA